jgi:hypothetical protein
LSALKILWDFSVVCLNSPSDREITETQDYLPNKFECIACGLKVNGLSRLTAIDLGERYKKTQIYDASEYYEPNDDYAGYEEDNNER